MCFADLPCCILPSMGEVCPSLGGVAQWMDARATCSLCVFVIPHLIFACCCWSRAQVLFGRQQREKAEKKQQALQAARDALSGGNELLDAELSPHKPLQMLQASLVGRRKCWSVPIKQLCRIFGLSMLLH